MADVSTGSGVKPEDLPQTKDLPAPAAPTTMPAKPLPAKVGGAIINKPKGMVFVKKPLTPIKPTGPAFKIETHADRVRYLKALIYGEYGAGKTRLCATSALVPTMRDVLMINVELGDLTLEDNEVPEFENVDYIPATKFALVARAYEFLKLHCQYRDANNGAGDIEKLTQLQVDFGVPADLGIRKYHTVIIDSISEIDAVSMDATMGITDATKIDADTIQSEWGDFRSNLNKMLRFIRSIKNLPMNVLFTAQQQWTQDEMKRTRFAPQLTGQLSGKVQGFMDLVGYLQRFPASEPNQSAVRRLFVQPTPKFAAKCRFSMFKKDYFEDPTMLSMMQQVGLVEAPKVEASPLPKPSTPLIRPAVKKA